MVSLVTSLSYLYCFLWEFLSAPLPLFGLFIPGASLFSSFRTRLYKTRVPSHTLSRITDVFPTLFVPLYNSLSQCPIYPLSHSLTLLLPPPSLSLSLCSDVLSLSPGPLHCMPPPPPPPHTRPPPMPGPVPSLNRLYEDPSSEKRECP